ncbi:MAG: dTDP-4-dehydrorhamnose reductase [Gammaproteobacteria bacterium]|nr:dTDP-4-dehydrorhamnose reductase [Gammaproteobacteria bacterium]
MKILLFGKNGQVGWELNRSLQPLGDVIAMSREDVDFSKPESLRGIVQKIGPDVIVNAVAYTAVDKAEDEEVLATIINGEAPGVLSEEAKKINALLVHYSTDYVFDGLKEMAYAEDDEPNPINAYGRSKLFGEKLIESSGCDFLIFRTSWVYGARGKNFLLTMIRLMQERGSIRVVNDQHGAPTCARQIAEITANAIWQSWRERKQGGFCSGMYHLASSGKATWYRFAMEIADKAKRLMGEENIIIKDIEPISSAEFPVIARRPMNSLLQSRKLEERYGLVMPDWEKCLDLTMRELS